MSIDRSVEHEIDGDTDSNTDVLATLDEQQANLVQMQEVAEATIEPGLFRLPVSTVSTAEEAKKWTITVTHPTEGDIDFHADKPTTEGWVRDQELVELLRWYQIHDRDPYKLQTRFVYIAHTGNSINGWELVKPPDYFEPEPPVTEQVKDRATDLYHWRPPRNVAVVWGLLFAGSLMAPYIASAVASAVALPIVGTVFTILVTALTFIAMTIIALAVTEP